LSEVDAICTKIIIINKGKILAEDTPENLYKKINDANKVVAEISGFKNDVLNVLWNVEGVIRVKILDKLDNDSYKYLIETKLEVDVKKPLQIALIEHDMQLLSLRDEDNSLEDIFLKFIQKDDYGLPKRELYDMDVGHDELDVESRLLEKELYEEQHRPPNLDENPEIWTVKLKDLGITEEDWEKLGIKPEDLTNLNLSEEDLKRFNMVDNKFAEEVLDEENFDEDENRKENHELSDSLFDEKKVIEEFDEMDLNDDLDDDFGPDDDYFFGDEGDFDDGDI
jgi:hypothetical protein